MENQIFTRLIYNVSGMVVGYQRYNWLEDKTKSNDPKGRYWTYMSRQDKEIHIGLVGLEMFTWGDRMYLLEGSFEQASAREHGFNALAVLCNNPKHLKNWLYCYPNEIVALCQNDDAGRKLANVADRCVLLPADFDDLTEEQINAIKEGEMDEVVCKRWNRSPEIVVPEINPIS